MGSRVAHQPPAWAGVEDPLWRAGAIGDLSGDQFAGVQAMLSFLSVGGLAGSFALLADTLGAPPPEGAINERLLPEAALGVRRLAAAKRTTGSFDEGAPR